MDLLQLLQETQHELSKAGIRHALIGGYALGAYQVYRATIDIDLMIDEGQKAELLSVMNALGFRVEHETSDVIQFSGRGPLDVLLARRPVARKMLETARMDPSLGIPVVSVEGLIGLKIQAYSNDPKRRLKDLADIQALIQANPQIDFTEVRSYADLFSEWPTIEAIRKELE